MLQPAANPIILATTTAKLATSVSGAWLTFVSSKQIKRHKQESK